MIDGVELFQLRQRRSAAGDTFFTGRFGNAFVILVRDEIERDLWRMVACDPSQTPSRDQSASPARAIAAPVNDGDHRDGNRDEGDDDEDATTFDDLPDDLVMASPSQLEDR